MMTSKEYLLQNQTAEQAIRNYELKRDIKENNLISLKPLVFTVAAVLLIVYVLASGIMSLPKQLDNAISEYNDEVIIEMNDLVGEVK